MKPRDRVVTAEDIQTSLYFVHVDQPEDSRLVEPPPSFREPQYQEQSSPQVSGQPQGNPVQRKAIPGSSLAPTLPGPKRKPVPGLLAPASNFPNRQDVAGPNYTQTSSNLLTPDYPPRRSFDSLQYQAENERPSFPSPKPSGTSLTLIRRDPASGAQWNVARIEDPQIPDVSSSYLNEQPKKQIGAPMFIEITNPGYSKFLRSEALGMSSSGNPESNMSVASAKLIADSRGNATGGSQAPQAKEGNVFRRRLWMEGARTPNGGFGHRRLDSQDSFNSTESPRNSSEDRRDRPSTDLRRSEAPPFLTRENQSYSTIQVSNRQSTFRGYVFMSPWNGRCEFLTGAGGGSLRVSTRCSTVVTVETYG